MKYGDLTYQEIRAAAENGALAIVPTGEQQGPHLPIDFDTWFAEQACLAGSVRARESHGIVSLVMPVLPFGPTPEHRNFGSGYIDLPQKLHGAVLRNVLESLAEGGFRKILIWRGCGQHDLSRIVERFNARFQGQAEAYQPDLPYAGIWLRVGDPNVKGGHADSFATSIALYLREDSVRKEWIPKPETAEVDWDDPRLDLAAYSSTGVIGDPTHASAELGAKLWQEVVREVSDIIVTFAKGKPNHR